MRRLFTTFILIMFFLAACSSVRDDVEDEDVVRLFLAMEPNVEYSEKKFSGDDADIFADLVSTECPEGLGDKYTRAVYTARGVDLVLYVADHEVVCSLLKPGEQQSISYNAREDTPAEGVALTVNGAQIMEDRVREQLTAVEGTENPVDLAVNRLVNDELLRQEAATMEVSDEEISAEKSKLIEQAGSSEAQIDELIAELGLTREEFTEQLETQAKLSKLLRERLLIEEVVVSDDELIEYYANNPNQFLQSEQAVMRQILIGSSRTEEQAVTRAQEAISLLETTDFCEIVKRYSDDQQNGDSCGVYVIPRGVIDPDLEFASFNTPVNQTAVVRTDAGIHLVQTLQVVPAQVVPYGQVSEDLRESLVNVVFQQRLNVYLVMLRSGADVQVYLS